MIIGVDAGCLGVSDDRLRVGVYRVVYHILQELGAQDTTNIYRLFSFNPIDTSLLKSFGPRMTNVVLRPTALWFTARLPLELIRHPVDLFLGVSQAIPYGAKKSIGWIYDVGFLKVPDAYPDTRTRLARQTETLVQRATHIVTISHSVKDDICKTYAIDDSKIQVSYPGVDPEFGLHGKKFIGTHPYVLFVGSLKKSKNIPMAIRGFARFLSHQHILYDFLLIGSNYWLDPEILDTVRSLGLSKRIKFMGYKPDIDLPMYYRGAVTLLSPSLWEGFCLPAVEAMACGCPVIGSTAGSQPEIIGKGGICVDPNDEISISTALEKLCTPETRRLYSREACRQVRKFRWSNNSEAIYRLIRNVPVH